MTIPSFTASGLVAHGYTSRLGGTSTEGYESLNLAFHVGDDPARVLANREKIAQAMGASLDRMVAANQTHGKKVHRVTAADAGRGAREQATAIPDTDALITDVPGILLSTFYADCVSLFFLDPSRPAVGLAHAGWKGTCQKIGAATVQAMTEAFGTDPAGCLAGIGPAIGPCCFQVGPEVLQEFQAAFPHWREFCQPGPDGRWTIDLWQANRLTLLAAGVKPENITLSGLCTSCRDDLFYSHRRGRGASGRQAALIMLGEENINSD